MKENNFPQCRLYLYEDDISMIHDPARYFNDPLQLLFLQLILTPPPPNIVQKVFLPFPP